VGLLEPVTLVQVRKARTVGASIDGLDGAFSPMRSAQLAAGSYLFPVGKKYDIGIFANIIIIIIPKVSRDSETITLL
jgi:hypothetical protein